MHAKFNICNINVEYTYWRYRLRPKTPQLLQCRTEGVWRNGFAARPVIDDERRVSPLGEIGGFRSSKMESVREEFLIGNNAYLFAQPSRWPRWAVAESI